MVWVQRRRGQWSVFGALFGALVAALLWLVTGPAAVAQDVAMPTLGPVAVEVQGTVPLARSVPRPEDARDERYVTAMTVEAYPAGGVPSPAQPAVTPVAVAHGQTDLRGHFTVVLQGLSPGRYDLVLRPAHALSVVVPAIQVPATSPRVVRLGQVPTPREGDADGDDAITILDFSLLAQAFGQDSRLPGYDYRVDFNQDGRVSIADFSLLLANWGQTGQAAAAVPPKQLVAAKPLPPTVIPPAPQPAAPVAIEVGEAWQNDDLVVLLVIALAIPLIWVLQRARASARAPASARQPAAARGPAASLAPRRTPAWQAVLAMPATVTVYSQDFASVEPLITRLEDQGSEVAVYLLDGSGDVPAEAAAESDLVVLDSDLSGATALTLYADLREMDSRPDRGPVPQPIVIVCPSDEIASLYGREAAVGDYYAPHRAVLAWAERGR